MELARAGADIQAVVVFHGDLSSPTPEDAKNIRAHVLALQGADDPVVNQDEIQKFIKEMRGGKVDWQLVEYGSAVHGFTNPANGNDPKKGAAYNQKAAERAWVAMKDWLDEIFKRESK